MMAAAKPSASLIESLPPVRGSYSENASLAKISWFRVGGAAEVMFRPADVDDLASFISACPPGVPLTVIGLASNLLVRDGGVPGVVVRLGREFADVKIKSGEVHAGAGAADANIARAAAEAGISGLEFLSGIPGTIGGALRMNAGAFGREMKDLVRSVIAIDSSGLIQKLKAGDLAFGYRSCGVPEEWIFVSAILRGCPGDLAEISALMAKIRNDRQATQPLGTLTGGSTFANPVGDKAWQLIERAGCRGLVRGGAVVSDKHCNFLVNTGTATAADLEGLGEEVRRRVFEASGVRLEWEIRRIGVGIVSDGEPAMEEIKS